MLKKDDKDSIIEFLKSQFSKICNYQYCGSMRRCSYSCKDIDCAVSDLKEIAQKALNEVTF